MHGSAKAPPGRRLPQLGGSSHPTAAQERGPPAGGLYVSPAGLQPQVSRPRAHAHSASGAHVRGTSHISMRGFVNREFSPRAKNLFLDALSPRFYPHSIQA